MALEIVQIPQQQQPNFQGMGLDDFFTYLQQSGQANDILNQPNETRLDDNLIKRNISNGLNMGNKTISDYINANNIRTPQTEEEKYDASLGLFNQPETLKSSVQTSPTFLDRFTAGYRDNYDNSFRPKNLEKDPNKTWANRLGEGLGTVGRFIDSPLGRGLLAAGLNKALGYNNSVLEGLQAFAGRQNAVTADKLYRKQLKDYGYTDEDLSQIRGNITSDLYKNLATNLYRTRNLDQNTYIKLKKAYDTQLQMGILSPEQYQANVDALNNQYVNSQVQTMQAGNVGLSNQTRNTSSQIDYRTKRLEQLDIQLQQNQQKIGILQQRVANGVASDAQKAELRALNIQQKQLENQILSEYIGNGGGGNPQPTRPVGTPAPKNNTPKTSGLKFVGVRNK